MKINILQDKYVQAWYFVAEAHHGQKFPGITIIEKDRRLSKFYGKKPVKSTSFSGGI